MLESEDARWIKATANELNNLLQVIAESREALEDLCKYQPGAERYLRMLHSSVDRATQVTRALAERAGGFPTDAISLIKAPEAAGPARIFPKEKMPTLSSATSGESHISVHNPSGTREMVMVVDDEEFIVQLAAQVLADEGYRVVTAKDGLQALEIYRRLKDEIALVILDFSMPVMDGADVFAEMQSINPNVSVVLSSGFTEHDQLRNMLARGLRGFIPKPYTQQKLLAQIRQTLDAVH